jgi:hypothetical protein
VLGPVVARQALLAGKVVELLVAHLFKFCHSFIVFNNIFRRHWSVSVCIILFPWYSLFPTAKVQRNPQTAVAICGLFSSDDVVFVG